MNCICCESNMVIWDEIKLNHCNSCGYSCESIKSSNPYINNPSFSEYFSNLEKLGKSKKLSELRISLIKKHGFTTGRIFDIGCSIGSFLEEAKSNGFNVSGVDCSDSSIQISKNKGLNVYLSEFESMNGSLPKSDCYTMYDVLEHLDSPKECLIKLKTLISENGIIVISVPNSNIPREKFLNWRHYKPGEHKHYFTKESLVNLLLDCGFQPLEFNFDESVIRFNYEKPVDNILTIVSRPMQLCSVGGM